MTKVNELYLEKSFTLDSKEIPVYTLRVTCDKGLVCFIFDREPKESELPKIGQDILEYLSVVETFQGYVGFSEERRDVMYPSMRVSRD